jgi:hypothetical protein
VASRRPERLAGYGTASQLIHGSADRDFKAPMICQKVKVLCDPAHTKARFDTSDPQLSYKSEQQAKQQHRDQEIGPQGSDPS